MTLRKWFAASLATAIAMTAAIVPGCSSGGTTVVEGDGSQIKKEKEEGGKKVLEPIPVTPGKSRQKKGSNGMDSSL